MIKYSIKGDIVKKSWCKSRQQKCKQKVYKCKFEDELPKREIRRILQKHKMFHGIGTIKNPQNGRTNSYAH